MQAQHRQHSGVQSRVVVCAFVCAAHTPPLLASFWQKMNRSLLRNEPQYPTAHPGPTPHAPLEPLTSNPLDYVLSHSHPAPPERTGSGSAHAAKPLAVLALSLLRLARPRTASVVRSPLRPAPVVLVALVRGASSSSSSSPPPPSSCSAAAARATAPVACRGAARAALRRAREAALHELG